MLPSPRLRLLRRVTQRCRTRPIQVGASIERLEEPLLLTHWSSDIPNGTASTNAEVQGIIGDVHVQAEATLTIELGFFLGARVDPETNGRPNATATVPPPPAGAPPSGVVRRSHTSPTGLSRRFVH